MPLTIGPHISSAKGFLAMGHHAILLGASTFAFFTRNPRGGNAKQIDGADAMAYRELAAANGIGPPVAHAAYTMNPCAKQEDLRDFTRRSMADDIVRLSHIPDALYNFHPGSHVGQGMDVGIERIAEVLCDILPAQGGPTVLLETMSGKGSEVGGRFEDLRAIIDRVSPNDRLGVCLDTCHCWDAGYDVRGDIDSVLTEFDKVVGLHRIHAVHLNDSRNDRGSHKDRHACIGEGMIGLDAMARIINHPALCKLPFILETPNEDEGWKREIELLSLLYKQ